MRKSQVTWKTVTKVSSDYLILMIWSSSFSDDNKHICKMFAIVMLWGSRFGQMRMLSYFMMTIFYNTFWWQFSDFWKIFRFFEILWPETWHLRHWLHVTLETLITLLTIENNIIKNYFVTFELRVTGTAFAILAMFFFNDLNIFWQFENF